MEPDVEEVKDQKVSLVRLILAASFATMVLVGIAFAYTPASIWSPKFVNDSYKENVTTFFPQGWAFFTKPSSEPHLAPYTTEGDSLEKTPAGLTSNAFGISREGRAQGVELALVSQGIPENGWDECGNNNVSRCLDESSKSHEIHHHAQNPTPSPSLCGEIIIMERQLVPYHYRDFFETRTMANKWARVSVEC